jgi:glucose-6-phosphate isomerase
MTWTRYKEYLYHDAALGVALDVSRIPFPDGFLDSMEARVQQAFAAMAALEKGAIANPSEKRMVGHYWLRAPELAPTKELTEEIVSTISSIRKFASKVHAGVVTGPKGNLTHLLVIGIGGSALGPQFVSQALGTPRLDRMKSHFFDNTDPDGFDHVLAEIGPNLAKTLVVVISKSGGTVETRNGQLAAAAAFKAAGLSHSAHFVAVTGAGSKLDELAKKEGWLARFPMWDWVGGRTSELCAVGLLPAALQGFDIESMLAGARAMDAATRGTATRGNPAALLALMWHFSTGGRGAKDMVVLPYKDRLLLFSRYLQQLVMESLGKELDLDGRVVNQGIAVYGNKGSTDQHAYVQQLREGVNNFFVTFIDVLKDRSGPPVEVEPGVTSGDYLQGFYLGTRDALSEKGRGSITLTLPDVSPRSVGMLIALYERVVGLYASLVGINAYDQPGVEAGKKAAGGVIALQLKLVAALTAARGKAFTAEEIAAKAGGDPETAHKILEHLSANGPVRKAPRDPWFKSTYSI